MNKSCLEFDLASDGAKKIINFSMGAKERIFTHFLETISSQTSTFGITDTKNTCNMKYDREAGMDDGGIQMESRHPEHLSARCRLLTLSQRPQVYIKNDMHITGSIQKQQCIYVSMIPKVDVCELIVGITSAGPIASPPLHPRCHL